MANKKGAGRPPIYRTAYELQKKIDKYFDKPPRTRTVILGKPPNQRAVQIPFFTITGLVLYLGFSDRSAFYDLEKQDKFSHTIKKARNRIAQEYEEQIQTGNTCAIFALKNFGWTDKQEVEMSGDINTGITILTSSKTVKL